MNSDQLTLRTADDVQTAPVVALGLVGGYLIARESGIRALGGALLFGMGALAARTWLTRRGAPTAAGLSALYLGAFGVSHPLAKKIGAWPSVLAVTAVAAGAAYTVSDVER